MHKVKLQKLRCNTQNEISADEWTMDVFDAAGTKLKSFTGSDMDKGETVVLEEDNVFEFEDFMTVELWERDPGGRGDNWYEDNDDFLGRIRIEKLSETMVGFTRVSGLQDELLFCKEGARYTLFAYVEDLEAVKLPIKGDLSTPEAESQEELNKWLLSDTGSAWSKITDKEALLEEVNHRLWRPELVNQASQPLCGPASIEFELAKRDPCKFIRICRDIYEKGEFTAKSETFKANSTLRDVAPPDDMAVVDWIFMTTLRDHANLLNPLDSAQVSGLEGFTWPGDLEFWMEKILDLKDVSSDSCLLWGEYDALEKAREVTDSGGVAVLLIDSAMLDYESSYVDDAMGRGLYLPNHDVAFCNNLKITRTSYLYLFEENVYQFFVQSWGEYRRVQVDDGRFEDCMWYVSYGYPK